MAAEGKVRGLEGETSNGKKETIATAGPELAGVRSGSFNSWLHKGACREAAEKRGGTGTSRRGNERNPIPRYSKKKRKKNFAAPGRKEYQHVRRKKKRGRYA